MEILVVFPVSHLRSYYLLLLFFLTMTTERITKKTGIREKPDVGIPFRPPVVLSSVVVRTFVGVEFNDD